MKKSLCLLGTIVLLVAICFSCKKDDTPPSNDQRKVVVILKEKSLFFLQIAAGVISSAEARHTPVSFKYGKNDTDYETQLATLKSIDLSQCKGVIITPTVAEKLTAELTRIGSQIPVIIIDTPVDPSVPNCTFIGTDNEKAGRVLAAGSKQFFDTNGNNLIFKLKDNPVITSRVEGFLAEYGSRDKFEIVEVDADTEIALATITQKLTGSTARIFAANGSVADLVIQTMKKLNLSLSMVSFDATQPIADYVYERKILNTCAQNTFGMGKTALETVLMDKKSDKSICLDSKLITRDNMFDEDVKPYLVGIDLSKMDPKK